MINLAKQLKRGPLPSGLFIVTGSQGVGKTSFATALLCADYAKHRAARYRWAIALAEQYYAENHVRLNVSENLYFSNAKILLDKRQGITTHWVDVQRLGLPNPDFDVQYLPRGSVVFIQEADLMLFNRDWADLSSYFVALCKFVRHNLLTIILDCQVDGAVDKAVRRLIVGRYHIEASYDKRFLFFWKRRVWRFLYIQNQLNDVVKDLAAIGVKVKLSVVQQGKLRFKGNIFSRYNSFSGLPYFLDGIDEVGYEYLPHPPDSIAVHNIRTYCALHPLVKPDDIKRGAKEEEDAKPKKFDAGTLLAFLGEQNGLTYCAVRGKGKEVFCARDSCVDCPLLLEASESIQVIQ